MPNHQQTQTMARFEQWHTHDFDEQAAQLAGWNQHYTQLSSGAFKGDIANLWCGDQHLFMETTSQALFQSGKLEDGLIAVGIPLYAAQRGLFCGGVMDSSSAHIFSGEDGFEFFSPVRLTMGGIVLPMHRLPSHLQTDRLHAASARLLTAPDSVIQDARAFLYQIIKLCQLSPALLNSKSFQKQLRAAAICCVSDILTDLHETTGLDSQRRWRIVKQAREILNRNTEESVSIASLCLEIGVSRRTLQYCFQDTLGINPVAFLRALRLNGVRRTLKEAESVTEAATAWGFWHFGNFSLEYKKLFGELPSDTLRREHG